ncbi:hypothetical protein AYK20_07885 [Thermoplasmatales archaeon SG8-52-1]|nr:MAG: hypothetical protein AYK20_07885 [Thermoplasmatales archaeon SG8-52-1]
MVNDMDELSESGGMVSRMFSKMDGKLLSDEELALHIIHKFNICRDTLEAMPAFDEHLETLFCKEKEK